MDKPKARRRPTVAPVDMVPQRQDVRGAEAKAKTDASYITVGVPSNFQWYGFRQLSIRPLRVPEVKKIHTAHVTDDLRMFYEALAPCIDQDIFNMTIGDAYSVMFWLRINSYPKTPYTVRFKCSHPQHLLRTLREPGEGEDWEQLPMESLDNSYDITTTDLEEIPMRPLEELKPALMAMELVQKGIAFAPSRVMDLVEVGELASEKWFTEGDDAFCRMASYLDPNHHGETLKERLNFVESNPKIFTPDSLIELDQVADLLTHGVRETINLPCKECGASNTVEVPIDARTFLPYLYPH